MLPYWMLNMVVFQATVKRVLQLYGNVGDAELGGGDVSQLPQYRPWVAQDRRLGGNVSAQRFVSGGDGPSVDVVNAGHPFQLLQALT